MVGDTSLHWPSRPVLRYSAVARFAAIEVFDRKNIRRPSRKVVTTRNALFRPAQTGCRAQLQRTPVSRFQC